MKMTVMFIALAFCGAAAVPLSAQTPAQAQTLAGVRHIHFNARHTGYPEGVAYDAARDAFFVSSLLGGSIGLVSTNGQYRVFTADPRLVTTAGILVDRPHNRLIVTNTSPRARDHLAQVVEIDLDTGAIRRIDDLSTLAQGATLANDLTVDPKGNIYVTDSIQPQIYRVDPDGGTSVLLRDEHLISAEGDGSPTRPYLNGIEYHPDGFLLAGDYSRSLLWKIPLDDPRRFSAVRLPGNIAKGPDGLRLLNPHELAVVGTSPDKQGRIQGSVMVLHSDDDWASAKVKEVRYPKGLDAPTTATLRKGQLWVTDSRFTLLGNPGLVDRTTEFQLMQIPLK